MRGTRIERHLAVAELGGDIDFNRQAGKSLEPIFADQAGIIGGAAGGDRNPLKRAEVEGQRHRQGNASGDHIEIVRERMADHFGLFVNLLGHEMAMVALVDQQYGSVRFQHLASNGLPVAS